MISAYMEALSISGNIDVGSCCICDLYDGRGKLKYHIAHPTLFLCHNQRCSHYCCKEHFLQCGYCLGCCIEEHNHKEVIDDETNG